jgi:hypothetical protein
MVVLLSS